MKAVMMNPATPARETRVVDCGNTKRHVGEEVGRFSGRAGGRIIITAELWAWIRQEQNRVFDEIRRQNIERGSERILPAQKEIIEQIRLSLLSGNYNNEIIDLGYSTIEKILTDRYQDMLKDGFPATEGTLIKEEEDRKEQADITRTMQESVNNLKRALAQIYLEGRADPLKLLQAYEARSTGDIYRIFNSVDWPSLESEKPPTLAELKALIKKAMEQKITKIKQRQRVFKHRKDKFTSLDEIPEEEE